MKYYFLSGLPRAGNTIISCILNQNKDIEIGKIMIDKPHPFALVKVVDPDLKEFNNIELKCGNSKIKILKPDWII